MNQITPLSSGKTRAAHQLSAKPVAKFSGADDSFEHRVVLHQHGYKHVTNVGDHYEIHQHPTSGHIAVHHKTEGWTRLHHHAGMRERFTSHGSAEALADHLADIHNPPSGDKK